MNPHSPTAPPSARDFEIFEQNQIVFLSTRRVAETHRLSQTRVRQIVTRVATWLAAHLPAKTEAEKEADIRLAQHLAAAQLRRQIEECQNYFDGSGDPKYLRHQTRIIVALARLGIVPGAIDSLAADVTAADVTAADVTAADVSDPTDERGAGLRPATKVNEGLVTGADATTDHGPLTTDSPNEGCSPSEHQPASNDTGFAMDDDITLDADGSFGESILDPAVTLAGLAIMERRLLTLIDHTSSSNHDRRSSLQETLANVRRNQAIFQLRLSPNQPGITRTQPQQRPDSDQSQECIPLPTHESCAPARAH